MSFIHAMDTRKRKRIALIAAAAAAAVIVGLSVFYVAARPEPVTDVKVDQVTYDTIDLSWQDDSNSAGTEYIVYRADGEEGDYEELATVGKPAFTDTDLATGTAYRYLVRATSGMLKSKKSDEAAGIPTLKQPKLKVTSKEDGVELSVEEVEGADGYVFMRDKKSIAVQKNPTFYDKGGKEAKSYDYQAVAFRKVKAADTGERKVVSSEKSGVEKGQNIDVSVELKDSTDMASELDQGDKFTINGKVVSNVKIKNVTVGVADAETGKWVKGCKYEKEDIDKKNFALGDADKEIAFGDLDSGKYTYQVKVETAGGTKVDLVNQNFEVKFNPAQAAVNWALDIAADDSFAYGTGKACHQTGCFFCGTNQKNKPKGYEKTYVCLTFVGAAYAHGAQDPEILAACQDGNKLTCYSNGSNFTRFSCWEKVGRCRDLSISDLKPGDVLVKWGKGDNGHGSHVCMYAGGNQIVEAGWEGWGADTIGVRDDAAQRLSRYGNDSKNYVMRYKQ